MSAAPVLEIEGLTLDLPVGGEYRRVLSGIDLTIGQGETIGLVGESGSGKSMTAKAIDRLLPPGARTGGSIRFDGSPLGSSPAELRTFRTQVAMVFQDPRAHINPVRRIGDFMTEAAIAHKLMSPPEARAAAVNLLESVGIDHGDKRLRQFPHELSGGMLQRVMIAAALLTGPKLLLADEPTTALDVTTQSEVMAILAELREARGLSMLFITHDLELAAAVCDRTAVMYAGQIVEECSSADLHGAARHPYTVALSAARPRVDAAAQRLPAIPGRPRSAFETPPDECAFADRCAHTAEVCTMARPELLTIGASRVRCARTDDLDEIRTIGRINPIGPINPIGEVER